MNIPLKDFQEEYSDIFLERVTRARKHVRDGEPQGILLSAPTGSGKTVLLTDIIEKLIFGSDGLEPNPEAVLLWLSDQPDLNEQSRRRLLESSDKLIDERLITVTNSFDAERLAGGKVYFLNTQKLSRAGLLTSKGDERHFTIWETIQNTATYAPDGFFVIIDEAHRGMSVSPTAQQEAQSIAQKFLLGSADDCLSPIPLVIGLSATPQKFETLLANANTERHLYRVTIDVDKVRDSGLIKDRLYVAPRETQGSDWTLLAAAVGRLQKMSAEWDAYCTTQKLKVVRPAMVIQVQDGTGNRRTDTNLETLIRTLEESGGSFLDEEIAHCFQDHKPFEVASRTIRYVDPTDIRGDAKLKYILFKTALTTGWDCPRAEVMMSFRATQEATAIAQLIGRMVRTPLARRIEGNEILNQSFLYLPHYDRDSVESIVMRLSGDADNVPATKVELLSDVVQVSVPEELTQVLQLLRTKPSYNVRKGKKLSSVRRLLRFVSLLAIDAVDPDVLEETRSALAKFLIGKVTGAMAASATQASITIAPLFVDPFTGKLTEGEVEELQLSRASISDMFRRAKMRFGDDLAVAFLKAHLAASLDEQAAKIELFLLSQDKDTWTALEDHCNGRIRQLQSEYDGAIQGLPSSLQSRYTELAALSRTLEPVRMDLVPSTAWPVQEDEQEYTQHFFRREGGRFFTHLGTWEDRLIRVLLKDKGVVCWLRNLPRKSWALSYAYEAADGTYAPGFPDLVVVRRRGKGFTVDLYEPHGPQLSDGWRKARGLARFADSHSASFGVIAFARFVGDNVQVLDFGDPDIRRRALALSNDVELANLFETLAAIRHAPALN